MAALAALVFGKVIFKAGSGALPPPPHLILVLVLCWARLALGYFELGEAWAELKGYTVISIQ